MLAAFFLTVTLLFVPLVVAKFLLKLNLRETAARWPIVLGLYAAILGVLASLFQNTAYGPSKLIGLAIIAVVLSLWVSRKMKTRRIGASLLFALGIAAILVLPHFWILGHQGWDFDPHKLFEQGTSYFRGPLNTDGERNVVLTEALLRREGSPFLPGGKFRYQLFWFYVSALVAGCFSGLTKYSVVAGITTGLSFVFFTILVGVTSTLYPKVKRTPIAFALVLLLLIWHSDFIHLMGSLFKHGRLGMEADGSIEWVFFRNFSLQLTTLLSPHHVFFFLFVALFLYCKRVWTRGQEVFLAAAVLASPILAVLVFPWFALSDLMRQKKVGCVVLWTARLLGIFVCHQIVYRFPLWEHFTREVGNEITLFPLARLLRLGPSPWVGLPSLWMTSLGLGGMLGTALVAIQFRRGRMSLVQPLLLLLLFGNIIVYYVVTGMELQRHFAIVSAFCILFVVLREISRLDKLRGLGVFVGSLCVASFAFQIYFMTAFTKPPSLLRSQVPWRDYFVMNQKLREEYVGQAVLSAMPHENGGFPVSLEAAPGFSVPFDTFIYTRLNPEQVSLLMRVNAEKRVVPYGKQLGYDLILWGPAEEKAWGPLVKERFIHPKALLVETGAIGLYRIRDQVREAVDAKFIAGTLHHDEALGEKLFQGEWNQEAFDLFQKILKEHPEHAHALSRSAKIFLRGGKGGEALPPLYKIIAANPANADALYDAGSALALTENWGAAKEMFERCLKAKPRFAPAQYRRGKMLSMLGRIPEAIAAIKTAIEWDPGNPVFQGGLGILYDRIGDHASAKQWYQKSLKLDPDQPLISERVAVMEG